jgi:hypothetical protein
VHDFVMELQSERHRRPRNQPRKTTGVVVRTENDVRGIAEPLERYGELLACQIVGLYNAIHGLPARSEHTRARLGRLFHESEGLPATGKIMVRPSYQWRYGYNHQTIYRRAPGTDRFLCGSGVHNARTIGWARRTRIVPISDLSDQEPAVHDAAVSVLMSSIEIEIRRSKRLRFATHLDVIKNASVQAQEADSPLSIPIGQLAHTFPGGKSLSLKDVHVKPDAVFGIGYPPADDPDYKFFALEYDRGTEDVEPTGNLARASWLRKVLSYSAISSRPQPIYHTYLRVPSLLVLCVFADPTRMANVMSVVERYAVCPDQFLFKTLPVIDPLVTSAPLTSLVTRPWEAIGGAIDLSIYEGR